MDLFHPRRWVNVLALLGLLTASAALAGPPTIPKAIADLRHYALAHHGNPIRGKAVFFDERKTRCSTCHKVHGQGSDIGPDLSAIGGKYDRVHLIESVLDPSAQIVEGFRTTILVTASGRVLTGIVKEESPRAVVLIDTEGRRRAIAKADIESRQVSRVSPMPDNLCAGLKAGEFADLIAYLESLRTGQPLTPGEASTGPLKLPAGFTAMTVATGLTGCTALEVAPDGRVFVCEQTGALRVIRDGKLLPTPFVRLPVDSTWERGLIGVTVPPDFPKTPFVYVCYVAAKPYPHHVVSRFTSRGDVAVVGSEKVLLEGDDQRKLGGSIPNGHQGGAIHFGVDGKLYVAIGEQTAGAPSQVLKSLLGKLLRINPDGTIPPDNPFVSRTRGKYRVIWALGLRNPFTFAVQPGTGRIYINDVGGSRFEEINEGAAGANYGWPESEGPTTDRRFRGPVYHYKAASIAGGAFVPSDSPWPVLYRGKYLFADFVHGWIKVLDPKRPAVPGSFATGLRRPVDLRFAPDGSLYVLLRDAWVIDREFKSSTGTLLKVRYHPSRDRK